MGVLAGVLLILRKNFQFHTAEPPIYYTNINEVQLTEPMRVIVYRKFRCLPKLKGPLVTSVRPKRGFGALCVLRRSQLDYDLLHPADQREYMLYFPEEDEKNVINDAFDKSDDLTEKLLGRGWTGKRPYQKLHHFM